jgi:hypothetical protein
MRGISMRAAVTVVGVLLALAPQARAEGVDEICVLPTS